MTTGDRVSAVTFYDEVMRELVLALGGALFLANAFALVRRRADARQVPTGKSAKSAKKRNGRNAPSSRIEVRFDRLVIFRREPADLAPVLRSFQKLRHGLFQHRVMNTWGDFGKRHQHKAALCHARMRDIEIRQRDDA